MYAFTEPLCLAWQALLTPLGSALNTLNPQVPVATINILFDSSHKAYQLPSLLIGHTCGYPYVKRWRKSHKLVCVPEFDIDGCRGGQNSSWFVCNANNPASELADFKGLTAAVNNGNSNSGMNVFRYALLNQATDGRFFNKVLMTGGHIASMRAVSTGRADIAAIDPVSYFHCVNSEPDLVRTTRIFGQSTFTMGLPFITPQAATPDSKALDCDTITRALNQCLDQLSEQDRQLLRINKFTPVVDSQYQKTADLELAAVSAGYPVIN